MPERWVSDESQSYYLDSEADADPSCPTTWPIDADLNFIDSPISFGGQHETTVQGTTPFSNPIHQHADHPRAGQGFTATGDSFVDSSIIMPLADQCLGLGPMPQTPGSKTDFGPYGLSTWQGEANLSAAGISLGESPAFHTLFRPVDSTIASFPSTGYDPDHAQGACVLRDPSVKNNVLSTLPIRGIDVELARHDANSVSMTEVAHDILTNSFVSALDMPAHKPRRSSHGQKEVVETASAPRKKRKTLGTKDQQTVRRPVNTLSSTHLIDDTFDGPLVGLKVTTGYNTSLPKSCFDMYIAALRQLVRSTSETMSME
jgi:hypothetical protein